MGTFKKEEAFSLISDKFSEFNISLEEKDFEIIFEIAGFHPFFLQVACSHLFDIKRQKKYLEELDNNLIKSCFESEVKEHYQSIYEDFSQDEKVTLLEISRGKLPKKKYLYTIKNLQNRGYLIDNNIFSSTFKDFISNVQISKDTKYQTIIKRNMSTIFVFILFIVIFVISYIKGPDYIKELIAIIGAMVITILTLLNNVERVKESFSKIFQFKDKDEDKIKNSS